MKRIVNLFGLFALVLTFSSCEITFNTDEDDDFENEFKIDNHWYDFQEDAYFFSTKYMGEPAYQMYLLSPGIRYNADNDEFRGEGYFISAIITGADHPQEGTFRVGGCAAVLYYGDTNPDDYYDFSSKTEFKAKSGKITISKNRSGRYTIGLDFETRYGVDIEGEFEGYMNEL